jgi:hypothetical protein
MGNRGKREFVQVLRLMEVFSEVIVATAALDAIRLSAISFDAVKQLTRKAEHQGYPHLDPTSFGLSRSQANGGNCVDQSGDAEEAAPRVDAAYHLVEGPNDQTASGDHLGHCRYGPVRMHEPEDRHRDEKDAEREVWCLSNGDRSRLAVAKAPEQKSSHHRACPIQIWQRDTAARAYIA